MKRGSLTALWLLFLFSLPLWMGNPYLLHVLIVTGIFIIAAMSLNLLLGYAGQLSLGHVAFFGIGAYASALVVARLRACTCAGTGSSQSTPKPVWLGMLRRASSLPAPCGWFIGRHLVQGARRLLRHRHRSASPRWCAWSRSTGSSSRRGRWRSTIFRR